MPAVINFVFFKFCLGAVTKVTLCNICSNGINADYHVANAIFIHADAILIAAAEKGLF